jgi:F-type H+-transporting ATPase subunit h
LLFLDGHLPHLQLQEVCAACPRRLNKPNLDIAGILDDLYLKGIKEYKVPAEKPGEADQHVKKFSPPAAPKSPEDANLASEMQAYETQQVEVEGQAASESGEIAKPEEDYFEDLEEKPETEAHH